MEFSEDLDLVQVQSHKLYHYDRESAAATIEINTHEDYLSLISNPLISKVFETYP